MSRFAEALAMVKKTPMASAAMCIKKHRAAPIPRAVCCPDAQDGTAIKMKEGGEFSRAFDMHGLRRTLPEQWGKFCRTNFRNSLELAMFFDTDEKTARNWLEGKHAPAAAFVLRAVTAFPEAASVLMGAAA